MNGRLVVDASFAVKWILEEEYTAQAISALAEWHSQHTDVFAPAWFLFEITNVLYQRIRRGELTSDDALRLISESQQAGVQLIDYDDRLHARALELAHQFNLNAAYDAHYLALAERMNCELWTADERLWNSTRAQLGWVRWIGELPPNLA